ncbi:hypothetical protein D3C78_1955920 [compost metagenome]
MLAFSLHVTGLEHRCQGMQAFQRLRIGIDSMHSPALPKEFQAVAAGAAAQIEC